MYKSKHLKPKYIHFKCASVGLIKSALILLMHGANMKIVESDWQQMAIWHMDIIHWIPKATNILSEYVILITDFILQQ
jgi:hypothetical protein